MADIPAAIDQYVPPGHHQGGHGSTGSHGSDNQASNAGTPPSSGPGASPPAGGASGGDAQNSGASLIASDPGPTERGGGSLPGTGYPLTPTIAVILAAIGIAVLIRIFIVGRRRLLAGR